MNYRARSYDPRLGRFIQQDPLLRNRVEKHYVYTSNNPLRHLDPLGLEELDDKNVLHVVGRLLRGTNGEVKTMLAGQLLGNASLGTLHTQIADSFNKDLVKDMSKFSAATATKVALALIPGEGLAAKLATNAVEGAVGILLEDKSVSEVVLGQVAGLLIGEHSEMLGRKLGGKIAGSAFDLLGIKNKLFKVGAKAVARQLGETAGEKLPEKAVEEVFERLHGGEIRIISVTQFESDGGDAKEREPFTMMVAYNKVTRAVTAFFNRVDKSNNTSSTIGFDFRIDENGLYEDGSLHGGATSGPLNSRGGKQ